VEVVITPEFLLMMAMRVGRSFPLDTMNGRHTRDWRKQALVASTRHKWGIKTRSSDEYVPSNSRLPAQRSNRLASAGCYNDSWREAGDGVMRRPLWLGRLSQNRRVHQQEDELNPTPRHGDRIALSKGGRSQPPF
jgi:hypothetical protein